MKTKIVLYVCLALLARVPLPVVSVSAGTEREPTQGPLSRRYQDGERLAYRMLATNRDRSGTTTYSAKASAVVKRDDTGRFFEEFQWSELVWNGTSFELPATNEPLRQFLSLSPERRPSLPDFSRVHPRLIGPMSDLLSFYADVWLAMRQPELRVTGDRVVVKHGDANSWADGTSVILGQDAIDFVIAIDHIDNSVGTVTVTVRHVPPEQPRIKIPAVWMRDPVADVPNNWVQVTQAGARRYIASIGKETFDVEIRLNLTTGKILSARMNNPVDVFERECSDEALSACTEGTRYQISRHIEISDIS